MFANFDRDRTHQNGTAQVMNVFDLVEDGGVFLALGLVNRIVRVLASYGTIGRDDHDAQFVNVEKLAGFGFGGAGHAGYLMIEADIILDRDGRQRLGFALDGDAFFGFNGLVETIAPAAAGHQTASVFVDDDDLVVLNDVLTVFQVKAIGLQQLGDGVNLLCFGLVFLLELGFGFGPLAGVRFRTDVDLVKGDREIGQHEGIRIFRAEKITAFLGEIGFMAFLINSEE